MTATSAVGVDDNLATSQAGIPGRPPLLESACRVDVIDGPVIEIPFRNHLLNQVLDFRFDVLLQVRLGRMLGRDNHRVHPQGLAIGILDGDL